MESNDHEIGNSRRIAGTVLGGLGSLGLIGSAAAKFAHVPKVVAEMATNGFGGDLLTLVAVLEIGSVLLFLVPLTRALGLQMISAFLGGAIATHIQHGQSPIPPAFVLTLFWTGAWLRHPIVLWSLRSRTREAESAKSRVGQETVLRSI